VCVMCVCVCVCDANIFLFVTLLYKPYKLRRGVDSLPHKRSINVNSLDNASIFASALAYELRKLVDLVRDSTFPAENLALADKAHKGTPSKSDLNHPTPIIKLGVFAELSAEFCLK
jgi:hypothetical protein